MALYIAYKSEPSSLKSNERIQAAGLDLDTLRPSIVEYIQSATQTSREYEFKYRSGLREKELSDTLASLKTRWKKPRNIEDLRQLYALVMETADVTNRLYHQIQKTLHTAENYQERKQEYDKRMRERLAKQARRTAAATAVIIMLSLLSLNYISKVNAKTGMYTVAALSIKSIFVIFLLIITLSSILFYKQFKKIPRTNHTNKIR